MYKLLWVVHVLAAREREGFGGTGGDMQSCT